MFIAFKMRASFKFQIRLHFVLFISFLFFIFYVFILCQCLQMDKMDLRPLSWERSRCFFCLSEYFTKLTWTAGSLTCVCGHSYECVYTRVRHHFWLEKTKKDSCATDGVRTRVINVIEYWVRRSTNGATPSRGSPSWLSDLPGPQNSLAYRH